MLGQGCNVSCSLTGAGLEPRARVALPPEVSWSPASTLGVRIPACDSLCPWVSGHASRDLQQLTLPHAANSTMSENAAVLPGLLKLGTRSQHLPCTNSFNPPGSSRRTDSYYFHHPCSTDGNRRHGEVESLSQSSHWAHHSPLSSTASQSLGKVRRR